MIISFGKTLNVSLNLIYTSIPIELIVHDNRYKSLGGNHSIVRNARRLPESDGFPLLWLQIYCFVKHWKFDGMYIIPMFSCVATTLPCDGSFLLMKMPSFINSYCYVLFIMKRPNKMEVLALVCSITRIIFHSCIRLNFCFHILRSLIFFTYLTYWPVFFQIYFLLSMIAIALKIPLESTRLNQFFFSRFLSMS